MTREMSESKIVAALQTTRGGSESPAQKNVLHVHGKPLFRWNLEYACKVKKIDYVFCLTNIPLVNEVATELGCKTIALPQTLAQGNHYEAIRFGLSGMERTIGSQIEIVIILLGNSAGALASDLDGAIDMLMGDRSLDSVCSVSEFNAFNPVRAMRLCNNGQLHRSMIGRLTGVQKTSQRSNEKNFMGNVYFFNGSFWVCRRTSLIANSGHLAFPWLGSKVAAWVQPPFMEVDAEWQLQYLRTTNILNVSMQSDDTKRTD